MFCGIENTEFVTTFLLKIPTAPNKSLGLPCGLYQSMSQTGGTALLLMVAYFVNNYASKKFQELNFAVFMLSAKTAKFTSLESLYKYGISQRGMRHFDWLCKVTK